ncbi:asparagine synthase (glutamine-hydrolyzing) [bacterium]|nr:asparagine synthase (glutamine-hydrolyzing) [candidate division CSSED10-310 bacterium]
MCGIAGIIDHHSRSGVWSDLSAMTGLVSHRGPDDQGIAVFPAKPTEDVWLGEMGVPANIYPIGLGHKRLSIIDLSSAGHQPMTDRTGRFWVVFNGEIYNYVELRNELKALGHQFVSRSDCEVLLQAYIQWGPACLERFNGMWAFCIYDRFDGSLFCARDRFGIKPFYYVVQQGRFAFASEIKQLLLLPWGEARANEERLADFFLWGLETHTDETFFSKVKTLPGSHFILLTREDQENGVYRTVRYWTPTGKPGPHGFDSKAAFGDLLADSVRLRLRSDVPVGATLSGGLDSSSIVCLAGIQRQNASIGVPFTAFNVEFAGAGYSERVFAESAARRAGATMVVLQPNQTDLADDWQSFVWHMEEPFGGLSYFSNYRINRLISQHGIRVVLSGQGGDELLLGYPRYRTFDALFKIRAAKPIDAVREVLSARRHANLPLLKQLSYGLYFAIPQFRSSRRRTLLRPYLNPGFFHRFRFQTEHLRRSMGHRTRYDLQVSELFRYQLPHLLRHDDRVSMAHSVETRLPFLDYRLLEFILAQPDEILFESGWSKAILRRAMENILPDDIRLRTDKMGYETPTGELIRRNRMMFEPLLLRHCDDAVLDTKAILSHFDSSHIDQRILCGAVSYLSWKETFKVS